ncbi:MAG TPA: hypothetical protein VEZ90_07415, partial [Blastocatellia bacterium]|nr:hypothetical protein [Blastocatellia bacterium]
VRVGEVRFRRMSLRSHLLEPRFRIVSGLPTIREQVGSPASRAAARAMLKRRYDDDTVILTVSFSVAGGPLVNETRWMASGKAFSRMDGVWGLTRMMMRSYGGRSRNTTGSLRQMRLRRWRRRRGSD